MVSMGLPPSICQSRVCHIAIDWWDTLLCRSWWKSLVLCTSALDVCGLLLFFAKDYCAKVLYCQLFECSLHSPLQRLENLPSQWSQAAL
ncbi:Hypothetical predicted protein [Podarcis lilfordi]|uniref:Uncharacterized protein n=1 Tax=Podarcis lilfordi TaxID=74358 RepID=A0AA35NYI2_9SAUR|nr:Hypothetical predicted protein [Podarcis lilfordi]